MLESGDRRPATAGWPLPSTGLPACVESPRPPVPAVSLLTEIALDEGDHAAALAYYQQMNGRSGWAHHDLAPRLARAVATTHPDESLALWRALADHCFAGKNRSAYEGALCHLRPMKELLVSLGRSEEWEAYLTELRTTHSRRPALLDTLRRLDDPPLLELR